LYTITLKEANNFITLGQYPEQSKPQNHLVSRWNWILSGNSSCRAKNLYQLWTHAL